MPYTFQTVSFTGDTFTELLGINDASKIVGFHGAATNLSFTLDLPSTFTPITITGVKTPPANTVTLVPTQTDAVGINNADQVVGFVTDNVPVMSGGTTLAAGTTRGFIDNGNVFSLVVAPGTAFNQLLGDNDVGQIVGYSSLDPAGMTLQLAYVYNEITKTFDFLDNATHTATLPANVNSQATGIDNAGDVVGFFMPTTTTSDGFLFSGGKLTTLQFPGSTFTQALGTNNKGQVVGFYNDTAGATHGFVYSNGFYTQIDVPGATATTVNGINDSDQIVGFDTQGAATDGLVATLPFASVIDTTNGVAWQQALTPYTGPVSYLKDQFIDITSDNLNMATTQPNVFLHSGAGEDAIQVTSGQNVLDGGTGSNFLVGGSGSDTFFVDDRGATADIWSTMSNFHSGDSATVWGVTPQDFNIATVDGQGAAGFTGLTWHITAPSKPIASLTLSGFTTADLTDGKLSVTFGTEPASTSPFMFIHAT